ncbi:hypothetical protein LCI18_011092 [Fusarium solani-melongenae]|uniref:Uncharacterized protein n=1 Tax=Fusarium solani subsp. cucurbitae TaxID=2747967 RepID=A0ACD3ZG05_FUSSC|nr:hypothetical protein LCI18_011092 [Fusarium solani-melongenae]
MDNNLSDLIRDYKLWTRFEKPHTIHLFNDPDAPPSSPQRLEQWKKNRTLGHGGQGRVVLQTCTRGSRGYAQRAVKMIPLKEGGRREYLRELEAIIKFSHDKYAKHFAKTMGYYTSKRTLYIAMEYFPKGDLGTYALEYAPLPEDECREIASQILRGLATMHQERFAHRDVKPQNVLIQQSPRSVPPAPWWVKLADFGISKRLQPDTSGSTRRSGTLQYMAPELLRSRLSGRSNFNYPAVDMWALGVTTFFVLTKRLPFQDISSAIDYASDPDKPFPRAALNGRQVSTDAQAFICALMKPKPTERLDSGAAMRHAWVHSFLPEMRTTSSHSGSSAPSSRSSSFDEGMANPLGVTNLHSRACSKSWSHEVLDITESPSETHPNDLIEDELRSSEADEDRDVNSISESSKDGAPLAAEHGDNHPPNASTSLPREETVDAESKGDDDHSSLIWAATFGHVARVKQLAESGADLEMENADGATALSMAAEKGHEEMVKLLVEEGADLESTDKAHHTPLTMAVLEGHLSVVKVLVEEGADVEVEDMDGYRPLMHAAMDGDEAIARLLIDGGANIEVRCETGETPLFQATANGHEAVVKLLTSKGARINEINDDNETALFKAAENGHTAIVRHLSRKGANIEAKGKASRTPLLIAALMEKETTVRSLISLGANLEAQDKDGNTALGKAAFLGHESVAKLLLLKGADLEARDFNGSTPLIQAAVREHEGMARLLVNKGANIKAMNKFGSTPDSIASRKEHGAMARILSKKACRRRR